MAKDEKLNNDAAVECVDYHNHDTCDNYDSMDIAYQNKDIMSKVLADNYADAFYEVLGLTIPRIVEAKPTNLPAIEANELRMDNLFLLADGSYAIIDYESVASDENKIKYLNYVARVTSRLYNEDRQIHKLRVIVIYTADVTVGDTDPVLDLGEQRLSITEVFLTDLDADKILRETDALVRDGIRLSDKDMIRLMLCPLSIKGHDGKQEAISKAIRIISEIEDEDQRKNLLKGLLTFTDKVISKEDSDLIGRLIRMTKVEMIFYKEQMEAVKKAREEEEKKASDKLRDIAKNLLQKGISKQNIADCVGIPLKNVEELAAQLNI